MTWRNGKNRLTHEGHGRYSAQGTAIQRPMCGPGHAARPAGPGKCDRPNPGGAAKNPPCAARRPGRVAGPAQQIFVNQAFIFQTGPFRQNISARFWVAAENPGGRSSVAYGLIFRSLPPLIFSPGRAFPPGLLQNSISSEVVSGLPPAKWSFGRLSPGGRFCGTGRNRLFPGGNPLSGPAGRTRGSLAFFFAARPGRKRPDCLPGRGIGGDGNV